MVQLVVSSDSPTSRDERDPPDEDERGTHFHEKENLLIGSFGASGSNVVELASRLSCDANPTVLDDPPVRCMWRACAKGGVHWRHIQTTRVCEACKRHTGTYGASMKMHEEHMRGMREVYWR